MRKGKAWINQENMTFLSVLALHRNTILMALYYIIFKYQKHDSLAWKCVFFLNNSNILNTQVRLMLTYLTTEQIWGSFTALTLHFTVWHASKLSEISKETDTLKKSRKGVNIIDVPAFRGAQLRQKKPDSPLKFSQKAAPNSETSSCSYLLIQVSMFEATSWEMALSVCRCAEWGLQPPLTQHPLSVTVDAFCLPSAQMQIPPDVWKLSVSLRLQRPLVEGEKTATTTWKRVP